MVGEADSVLERIQEDALHASEALRECDSESRIAGFFERLSAAAEEEIRRDRERSAALLTM